MYKKLIYSGAVIFVIAFLGYSYIYQEHRNIEKEKAEHVVTAEILQKDFLENPEGAKNRYLNKTLIVKGKITELNADNLTMDNKVFCGFTALPEGLKLQETLTIKGRCIGFDDLLEQVKLDQCSIIK